MNLKKLFEESGHKAVARAVLQEYSTSVSLKRPVKRVKVQVMVSEPFYEYVKLTAKSSGKIGERLDKIILSSIRNVADETVKLY